MCVRMTIAVSEWRASRVQAAIQPQRSACDVKSLRRRLVSLGYFPSGNEVWTLKLSAARGGFSRRSGSRAGT